MPEPPLPVDDAFADAYQELRRVAHARLRGSGRQRVLDTTALVHETYLKLSRGEALAFPDRARFLVYAGRAMRSIIVDLARQRRAERHGGEFEHITFTGSLIDAPGAGEDHILRVHEALEEMARVDPRMAQVVELRYFGGLTDAEVGQALGVTDRTVRRDWEQARLFLAQALR